MSGKAFYTFEGRLAFKARKNPDLVEKTRREHLQRVSDEEERIQLSNLYECRDVWLQVAEKYGPRVTRL
jgi:hypothetical protein